VKKNKKEGFIRRAEGVAALSPENGEGSRSRKRTTPHPHPIPRLSPRKGREGSAPHLIKGRLSASSADSTKKGRGTNYSPLRERIRELRREGGKSLGKKAVPPGLSKFLNSGKGKKKGAHSTVKNSTRMRWGSNPSIKENHSFLISNKRAIPPLMRSFACIRRP